MTENTYRKVSQDELEYERREARLKYQLQYNTEISVAREQGLAQGLKKGEAQKQREIAKNLKALNLTKEQIAEAKRLIDGCERAICTVKLPETGAEAGMAAGLCELKEYAARQGKLEGI